MHFEGKFKNVFKKAFLYILAYKNNLNFKRLVDTIWSEYTYCITSVYVLCKDSIFFLRLMWEDSKKGR